MRGSQVANVDTMGCAVVLKPEAVEQDKAYHTLISLMLSSQTTDVANHGTMKVLVHEKNLSIDTILNTPAEELEQWISKVGFYKKKAIYIKKAT
jgi:endonuclease-3